MCTEAVVTAFKKVPGVLEAKVDFEAKKATVSYDPSKVSLEKLSHAVDGTQYKLTPAP